MGSLFSGCCVPAHSWFFLTGACCTDRFALQFQQSCDDSLRHSCVTRHTWHSNQQVDNPSATRTVCSWECALYAEPEGAGKAQEPAREGEGSSCSSSQGCWGQPCPGQAAELHAPHFSLQGHAEGASLLHLPLFFIHSCPACTPTSDLCVTPVLQLDSCHPLYSLSLLPHAALS